MKQRKVVKIDGKEFTIKELAVKELLYLCYRTGWINDVLSGIDFKKDFVKQESMDLLDTVLDLVSDISREELILLAPSEIKELYGAFIKINETTISMAKYLGIGKIIEDTKDDLIKTFMSSYSSFIESSTIAKMPAADDSPIRGEVVPDGKGPPSEK